MLCANKMENQKKTKEQLRDELLTLSQQVTELEELKAEHRRIVEQLQEARSELAIRVKVRTAEVTKANEDLQKEISERRRIEEALRESEERFRNVADNARDTIWEVDKEGRYTYVSSAVEKVLGYKPEEMLGKYLYDFFHPDEREQLRAAAGEIIVQKGKFQNFINRNMHKDGRSVILETSGVPIIDKDGNFSGYRGVDRDVTERIRTEESLKNRLEFEGFIAGVSTNFINLPIEKIDAEINRILQIIGEFAGADRSYVFLLSDNLATVDNTHEWCAEGIEPQIEKLKGLNVKDFPWWAKRINSFENIYIFRLSDLPEEAAREKNLLESEGVKSLIVVPLVYSGSAVGFFGFDYVRAEHALEEEIITLLKIVGDIFVNALQRKETEEEIIRKEHFLSSIFDSIQDGLSILDMELNIIRVNSTIEKWYAHAMPLVGKKCYEVYHGRSKPCDVCPSCRTIQKGETAREVVPRVGYGGKMSGWLELYSFPLLNSATAQMSGVIEYVRDITERKQAEEELKESESRYRTTLDSMVAAIHVIDPDMRFILINNTFKEWNRDLGLETEVIGKTVSEAFPFLPDKIYQEYRTVFDTGKSLVTEEFTKLNGREFITETRKIPVFKGEKVNQVITVIRDITEYKRTEERIIKINECFLNFGNDPIDNINHLTSLCGGLLGADCALYNRLEGDKLYSWGKWHPPEGFESVSGAGGHLCYDVIKQNNDEVMVVRNLNETEYAKTDPNVNLYKLKTYIGKAVKLGDTYIGSLCVVYKYDFIPTEEDKRFLEIIAVAIGVEEGRKNTEDMLKQSQARYRAIVEDQAELICRFLPDKTLTFVNEAYCRYFGKKQEEILGKSFMVLIPQEEHQKVQENFSSLTLKDPVMIHEHKIITADGEIRWQQWTSRGIFDNEGRLFEYQAVGRDITERKEAEKEREMLNKELMNSNKKMKQLALRDPHTGLYNHRYLEEVIEAEFYRARRYAHPISVLMLDIDYFKSINDVYGYPFGDLVLQQLAQQLKRMVRRYDIIIRFSGEEFIILCPGTERATALMLAQRLLDAFNLYNFGDKKHRVKLKLSLAVASYPEDKIAKGIDLIELAERMIIKIKEDGGNKVYTSLDVSKKKYPFLERYEKGAAVNILKKKIDKLNRQANQSLIEAIFAFAKTIEVKDHYTGEHVEKTVYYATEIARALGLSKDETGRIKQAAMLHDLGKIGISEKILLKKSKLSKKEFEIIKTHPQLGVDIIRPIQFLHAIIPLIFYHHERWDGRGYPTGLRAEDIPIGARIIAIADVYQALISDRPYRKAFPKNEVLKIMKEGAGTQFDPQLINVFLKILKKNNH